MAFQDPYVKVLSGAQLAGKACKETHNWVGGRTTGRKAVCRC